MAASDRSAVEEAALAASGRSALRLGEEKIGVIEVDDALVALPAALGER